MIKSKKRRLWITVTIIALVIVGVFFFPETNSVGAIFNGIDQHSADVLYRVFDEILIKSPAWQYYTALLWKHSDEFGQIYQNHPDHDDELSQIIQSFIPGLEALLDGKGDTVRITEEQVISLKVELDWLASIGSPSLREDIEKEQQRYPLENFVGMTMSDALNYVNSNWKSDASTDALIASAISAVPTEQPIPTQRCVSLGLDPTCQIELLLVPNSNGSLAYHVLNGVYFEYPSNWVIQYLGDGNGNLQIFPASDSPEELNMRDFQFSVAPTMNMEHNHSSIASEFRFRAKWEYPFSLPDFQGGEFLWGDSTGAALEVFLKNENNQIAVGLYAMINPQIVDLIDNGNTLNEIFPNIHHIVESIRIGKP